MSKIKVLLNVVEGMRSLADSMAELVDVIAAGEDTVSCITTSGGNAPQAAPNAPHGARNVQIESQQGTTVKPVQEAAQPQSKQKAASTQPTQLTQPVDDEPKFDLVALRAAVAEYSTPENRPKIKEILTHFGVKKLTELKEEQYTALFAEVVKACEK